MTRGSQMRRTARRMRRYGFQPMMFVNGADGLPEIAAVVLARWAWRYRSELAPLTTAAGMSLAAWVLHVTRPGWWLPIAATSAVLAGSIATALMPRSSSQSTSG